MQHGNEDFVVSADPCDPCLADYLNNMVVTNNPFDPCVMADPCTVFHNIEYNAFTRAFVAKIDLMSLYPASWDPGGAHATQTVTFTLVDY